MKSFFLALFAVSVVACASKPKSVPANAVVVGTAPVINYQKEKSHFMNVSPAVAVGHFALRERFCTESTYWYSNLLDYVRARDRVASTDAPVVSDDLMLSADGTYRRARQIKGAAMKESTGTVSVLEQGPTKIMAITHPPKNAKPTSDTQAHHRIELTLTEDGGVSATWVTAVDLVSSTFDKVVLVTEVHGDACGPRDSLNEVYERVKP